MFTEEDHQVVSIIMLIYVLVVLVELIHPDTDGHSRCSAVSSGPKIESS